MNELRVEMYQDWLDEIFCFAKDDDENIYMTAKYETALKAVEIMGFDWQRDEKGNHKIY